MAVNDNEALEEFTRVLVDSVETVVEVLVITWQGPHTPSSTWVEVERVPTKECTEPMQLRKAALRRKRYFKICSLCGHRRPSGWMHTAVICQSCAERELGVIH